MLFHFLQSNLHDVTLMLLQQYLHPVWMERFLICMCFDKKLDLIAEFQRK